MQQLQRAFLSNLFISQFNINQQMKKLTYYVN